MKFAVTLNGFARCLRWPVLSISTVALALPLHCVASEQPVLQPDAARMLVQQAAEALGGSQRVRDVRNITMAGYG